MTVEIVDTFPHAVTEIEFARIPLSDGVRLACRYWLPEGAEDNPVPAILEYIPYCTRDGTASRDEAMHPYFAGHGYAAIRVDIRGSGESEGVLLDEYLELEQDDALEVIAWIAEQPWCDGNVGMMGKSWGGFNGLQVAAWGDAALWLLKAGPSSQEGNPPLPLENRQGPLLAVKALAAAGQLERLQGICFTGMMSCLELAAALGLAYLGCRVSVATPIPILGSRTVTDTLSDILQQNGGQLLHFDHPAQTRELSEWFVNS